MSDAVLMSDVRAARLCSRGLRVWLDRHGFVLEEFLRHGIPIEKLEATGDHFALLVAEHARKRLAMREH